MFDNPTLAYENGDEIGIFIDMSGGLSNMSNEAACRLTRDNDIPINDLYSVIEPHISEYIADDLIHPNAKGIEAIAAATAEIIADIN